MIRRSKEEWKALILAQKASGLNQQQFCKEHGIDPGYFSTRKKQLFVPSASNNKSTQFVKLDLAVKNDFSVEIPVVVRSQGVEIELTSATAPFLAELLQCLR